MKAVLFLTRRHHPARNRGRRREAGVALIEATTFVFMALLLLSGILLVAQSRRERLHKRFYNTVAEAEGRALVLDLRSSMTDQITRTGAFDPETWDPAVRLGNTTDINGAVLMARTAEVTGTTVAAFPGLGFPGSLSDAGDPFHLAPNRRSTLTLGCLWEPVGLPSDNQRTITKWQIESPVLVDEVPLSSFNYYAASALERLLLPGTLGRAHFEQDVSVEAAVELPFPVTAGGKLAVSGSGALFVRTNPGAALKGFLPSVTDVDFRTLGDGLVFDRDTAPVPLRRPVSTGELFSTVPLSVPDKERQRLKPQCVLRVSHTMVAGVDQFTYAWSVPPATPPDLSTVFLPRSGSGDDQFEMDLSAWPVGVASVWVESDQAVVKGVKLKNAAVLNGAFSFATPLEIRVQGNFNTTPVRPASLLTLQRVVAVP